jgi:HEAT repeat protein
VTESITNYKLRITNLESWLRFFVFLCAFAGNSFAQDLVLTQAQIDRIAEEVFLKRIIQTGNTEQKRDALFRIRNLESEAASRIAIPALRDSSEIVRATAAFSVIFLPKDEALQVLAPLLQDRKELVRREAAYALGKVRNPAAINPLIQVLQKDKITEVRNAAVISLGEIGDPNAVDVLTQILRKKPEEEEEFFHRSAARSIGQIAQIIQIGETRVLTPKNFLPDYKKIIAPPKYSNLTETFPVFRPAVTVLIQTLQNPRESQDAKREAAFALGAIGDKSAIPALTANLNSEDYYLAEICEEALKKISAG